MHLMLIQPFFPDRESSSHFCIYPPVPFLMCGGESSDQLVIIYISEDDEAMTCFTSIVCRQLFRKKNYLKVFTYR